MGDKAACGTCRFFVKNAMSVGTGECRRLPPSVISTPRGAGAVFPSIKSEHWCGEYQAKIMEDSD